MDTFLSDELRKAVHLLLFVWACTDHQQVKACGGFYTSPTGFFSSPLYPSQYPPDQDCVYIINTTDGYRISLTFLYFQLQAGSSGCNYDYLQIRDGSSMRSPSMGIFCNTTVPGRLRSTSNTMWIRFRSDSSVSGAGFQATYTTATSGRTTATSDRTTATSDRTTATRVQTTASSDLTPATSDRTPATSDQTTATTSETPNHFHVTGKSNSKEHLYISTTSMIIAVVCAAAAALATGVVVAVVASSRRRRDERKCEKPVTIAGRKWPGKAGNLRVDYSALVLQRDYDDEKQRCLEFRANDNGDNFQDSRSY